MLNDYIHVKYKKKVGNTEQACLGTHIYLANQ